MTSPKLQLVPLKKEQNCLFKDHETNLFAKQLGLREEAGSEAHSPWGPPVLHSASVLLGTQWGCPIILDRTSRLWLHEVLQTEQKPGCSPQRLQRGLWGRGQPENLATVNLASPVDLEPRFGCFCTDRPGKRGGGCLLIKGRWAVMSVQGTGEPPAGRVPRAGLELDLDIPWRPSELPRQGCASTPTAQAPWKVWLMSNLL